MQVVAPSKFMNTNGSNQPPGNANPEPTGMVRASVAVALSLLDSYPLK